MMKMNSLQIEQGKIVTAVEKLKPQAGDVFIFKIKTDDNGIPLVDFDVINQVASYLRDVFKRSGAEGVFLVDKICLFSIENINSVKKDLENIIFALQEAIDKVRDIENGTSEENFVVIDTNKRAEGPV